jgi:hypothetical protein
VDGVSELLGNPEWARELGVAGWRRLVDNFTSVSHQGRVIDLLRPLLGRGRPEVVALRGAR